MKERSYWERRDAVLQNVYYLTLSIVGIVLMAIAFAEKMFYFDFFSKEMDMVILFVLVLQIPILHALALENKAKVRVEILFSICWCIIYIIISLPIVFLLGGLKNVAKYVESYSVQCARNERRRIIQQKKTP